MSSRGTSPVVPLVLLATGIFLAVCTEMLPVGLLPEIADGLGVTTSAAGILVTFYAVLVAVVSLPLAAVTERWPRRRVLVGLLATYALSNVAFTLAPGYGVAVAARVLGGVAHAGFFSVAVATAVSLLEPARAGRAVAVVMVGNASALVLGVPLGTTLGTAVGWRWAFGVLAVALCALALAVARLVPAPPPAPGTSRPSVLAVVRRPPVLAMAAVVSLLALGHFTLYTYVSPLLLDRGVDARHVGAVLLAYGCGGLVGLALAGVVVSRCPGRALVVDGVVMASCLALAALVGSTVGAVVVVAVWGVAFGAFPTLTQTVTLQAADGAGDASAALVNATTNVGIAGGAFVGSQVLRVAPVGDLGLIGAGLVVASLVVYVATRRRLG